MWVALVLHVLQGAVTALVHLKTTIVSATIIGVIATIGTIERVLAAIAVKVILGLVLPVIFIQLTSS